MIYHLRVMFGIGYKANVDVPCPYFKCISSAFRECKIELQAKTFRLFISRNKRHMSLKVIMKVQEAKGILKYVLDVDLSRI